MKKKPVKRKSNKTKKIKFTEVKKNYRDKFEDEIQKFKHASIKQYKSGKKKGDDYFNKKTFRKLIKKDFKLSDKQLKQYHAGIYTKKDRQKINSKHKGFSKVKKQTKKFYKHTFTFDNFFKKDIGRLKKHEQFYFRCGIKIVSRSKDTGVFEWHENKLIEIWTIPNFTLSHYSQKQFPSCYKEFFNLIKTKIDEMPSILYFTFNYFDVEIIDMTK